MNPVAALPPHLLAYLAGLIDGGGCIAITRRRTKGRPYYAARVVVGRASRAALEPLERTGLGSVTPARGTDWRWELTAKKAVEFVTAIRPYLVAKAANADLVLKLCEATRRTGRRGASAADQRTKAECYESFKSLTRSKQ